MENKLSLDNFIDFLDIFYLNYEEFPQWRIGQTVFNSIDQFDAKISNKIRTTDLDPYYNVDRVFPLMNEILSLEAFESPEAVQFFTLIMTSKLENYIREQTSIPTFCLGHSVEIKIQDDLQYYCYIDGNSEPEAIELDAYSALVRGIYNYLNQRDETKVNN